MRIFLGNAPWREKGKVGVRAGSRWPHFQPTGRDGIRPDYLPFPFFLAYAAAVLERENFSVMLRDAVASGDDMDSFLSSVKAFSPDLVLLETSTPTINIDLDVVRLIKGVLPRVLFAFAGPHAPMFDKSFIEQNPIIDYVLCGEYEFTLLDLVKRLKNGKSLDDVPGLIFHKNRNSAKKNQDRQIIEDLDSLPLPARHLLPIMNYNDSVCNLPRPNIQVWASRGCPYGCIFCAWPQIMYGGKKYRTRNPALVAEEVDLEVKRHGFKGVYFDDDTFNLQKKRVMELCSEWRKRDLHKRVAWAIMARADAMDEELLVELKNSGLYAVKYGVETGSQELISKMGKNLDLEKVEWVVRRTKELGIRVHLTFSFGHIGETKETINKTISTAILWEPDAVQFSIITPFPGSKYYDILERDGRLNVSSWEDFNGSSKAVFSTDSLSVQELENAREEAYERWKIETEHKNSMTLQRKLSAWVRANDALLQECSEVLIIRSSFLAHTKNVASTLSELGLSLPTSVLAQENIISDIEKWNIFRNIYLYAGGEFDIDTIDSEVLRSIESKGRPLVMVLYNNLDGIGYENVRALAANLKARRVISVNTQGAISELL